MTGTDSGKWIASFSTLLATRTFRGKRTFLMREALARKIVGAPFTEFESHCHGNWPAMRKSGNG
jgi:hypothetical protein